MGKNKPAHSSLPRPAGCSEGILDVICLIFRGRKRRGHGPNDDPQKIKTGETSPKSENSRNPNKKQLRLQHVGASVGRSCSHFGAPDCGCGLQKSVSVHCQPIMSTADWEFFRARGKQRGFSLVAAAPLESSQSLYGWTFWGVKQGSYPSIHQTLEHSRKTSEKYLFFAKIRIEPIRAKEEKEKKKKKRRKLRKEIFFHQKSVTLHWTLAGCEWCAVVPGLKPLRLPHAQSPGMGKGGDW